MRYHRVGIAKQLIIGERYRKARQLLLPLACRGNAEAQLLLGYLYLTPDRETTKQDAIRWLKKSASRGNAEAMAILAQSDLECPLANRQYKSLQRLRLLFKAARKGSAEAQRSLACCYAHGDSLPQDDERTVYWDEKAARQGLAESQNDLALMLLHGIGTKKDPAQAIYWYMESARHSHNAPFSEFAANALAHIYRGEPDSSLKNEILSRYWKKQARRLSKVSYRAHPDWLYEK